MSRQASGGRVPVRCYSEFDPIEDTESQAQAPRCLAAQCYSEFDPIEDTERARSAAVGGLPWPVTVSSIR